MTLAMIAVKLGCSRVCVLTFCQQHRILLKDGRIARSQDNAWVLTTLAHELGRMAP